MTVTEYFTRLQGKRVLVLGLGVSNRPLVRLLLRFVLRYAAAIVGVIVLAAVWH